MAEQVSSNEVRIFSAEEAVKTGYLTWSTGKENGFIVGKEFFYF